MVLWPENNFQQDSGQQLADTPQNSVFFPTTLWEPNMFEAASGAELTELEYLGALVDTVTINDYIFWSSSNDNLNTDIRRVTLGTLLNMIEFEALGNVILALPAKTSLTGNDLFAISDSAAAGVGKKITWTNILSTLSALYAAAAHTHTTADVTDLNSYTGFDARYFTEAEITSLLSGKAATAHTHTTSDVTDLSSYTGFDARYFTEAEVTSLLSGKSATGHTHTTTDITDLSSYTGFDARYFTEAEITSLLAGKQDVDAQLTALAALAYAGNSLKVLRVNAGETGFEFATITAGSGDVVKVGTPVDNQLAIWTGDGTLEGTSDITYNGTSLNLITGKNFQIAGLTILSDSAGTTTLSNIDVIDATTEAAIESAIDTLANLTSIQGRTVTLIDAGADAIFGWDDSANAYQNLSASDVRAALGLATTDSPMLTAINLGHASDTTITRVSAGLIAVESIEVPTVSSTHTLTNKRITPRVTSETSSATPTINTDNSDAHSITALAVAITSMTTNLSGTPTNFQKLIVRFKDNGTARAITWGASFEAKGVALPTTTVISKVLTVGFIYDTVTSKWGCVASAQEA